MPQNVLCEDFLKLAIVNKWVVESPESVSSSSSSSETTEIDAIPDQNDHRNQLLRSIDKQRRVLARRKLHSRKHDNNETVTEYAWFVKMTVPEAYPLSDGISLEIQQKLSLDIFMSKLNPKIKGHLLHLNYPETLEEAIEFARIAENFLVNAQSQQKLIATFNNQCKSTLFNTNQKFQKRNLHTLNQCSYGKPRLMSTNCTRNFVTNTAQKPYRQQKFVENKNSQQAKKPNCRSLNNPKPKRGNREQNRGNYGKK